MIQVDNYGLHFDGAVAWLLQGRGGYNFIGLGKTCPFSVSAGGACNHLIPSAAPVPDRVHWANFLKFATDPLVEAMYPLPGIEGDRTFFFEDPYDDLNVYIACLSRLSSPIRSVMKPAWMVKADEVEYQMGLTNVQPWVITQVTQKEQKLVDRIAKASFYLPRTVVFTGKPEVVASGPVQRTDTWIRDHSLSHLVSQPMESIGATLIRRYGRREALLAPVESLKERSDRKYKERKKKNE